MLTAYHVFPSYIPPVPDLPLKLFRKAFPPISPPQLPPLTLRIPVTVARSYSRVYYPFLCHLLLPSSVLKPLERMSLLHAQLTNATNITASVKIVHGTPCPRWHMDKVPLRGLCTLHGPGCEIMTEEAAGNMRLEAGDLVYLPGAGRENDREGVVHKSPEIDDKDMRVVLQTDCVDEGCSGYCGPEQLTISD